MLNKIKFFFFITICLCFLFLIIKYYFSEENIILTNKLRSSYAVTQKNGENDLPLLKSDTNNIIAYINGLENFKNKRKKRFWEKLIFNNNE